MKKKRPTGVILIALYYAITFGGAVLGIAYALLANDPSVEYGKVHYQELSGFAFAWHVFSGVLGLSAATVLFFMRKAAVALFIAVFIVGLVNVSDQLLNWGWFGDAAKHITETGVIISVGVGMVVQALITFYVWRLGSRGQLS